MVQVPGLRVSGEHITQVRLWRLASRFDCDLNRERFYKGYQISSLEQRIILKTGSELVAALRSRKLWRRRGCDIQTGRQRRWCRSRGWSWSRRRTGIDE